MFNTLDLNHDGIVTLGELQHSGGVNLPAVQDVINQILAQMDLGAGNENFVSLGVKLSDLPRRLCGDNTGGGSDENGHDAPKVCPIFPEPPPAPNHDPEP